MTSLKAATSISVVTLGSRILGLVRDVMMIRMLDFSWALGTLAIAWMVPNMLRRLFGEGALAASFIPAYKRAKDLDGPAAARSLLGSVTGLLLLALGTLTAVVLILTFVVPPAAIGRASETITAETQGELLLRLVFILFPYVVPICLAAILAGALNAHGKFALPAAAPIVLNVFWIGAIVYAYSTGMTDPEAIVELIAVCLLVGGLGQLSLSLIPLARRGLLGRPQLPGVGDPARDVIGQMGPTLIGMSLLQLSTMVDQVLAMYLVGAEAPGFLYQANRLLLFPHALTSLALATAMFPRFASLGAKRDLVGMRQSVERTTHRTAIVAVPAAVGMMFVSHGLLTAMLSGDKVTAADIELATHTTVFLVASLPFIGVAQLYARALYSLGDYRTPAWLALWLLIVNVVLDLVFVVGLDMGVPGFALATALASAVNAVTLRQKLRWHCPDGGGESGPLWPILFGTAVMAVTVWTAMRSFTAVSRFEVVLYDIAIPVVAGMAVYAIVIKSSGMRLR